MLLGRRPLPPWRSGRVVRAPGAVRITIEPKRAWLAWAAFVAAAVLWGAGGYSAYGDLVASRNPHRRAWVACWLLFWMGWGVWAITRLALLVLGRELLEMRGNSITLRREIAGIGRSHRFEGREIRDLFLATPPPVGVIPPSARGWPPLPTPLLAGTITFQYRSRKYECGFGLGWPDMEVVLEAVRASVRNAGGAARGDEETRR